MVEMAPKGAVNLDIALLKWTETKINNQKWSKAGGVRVEGGGWWNKKVDTKELQVKRQTHRQTDKHCD